MRPSPALSHLGLGTQQVLPPASFLQKALEKKEGHRLPPNPFPTPTPLFPVQPLQNHLIFTEFSSLIIAHVTNDKGRREGEREGKQEAANLLLPHPRSFRAWTEVVGGREGGGGEAFSRENGSQSGT